jgi:antitoxin component YwqK of YwqJK toxin-antitoxin module
MVVYVFTASYCFGQPLKINFFPGLHKRGGIVYKEGSQDPYTGDSKSIYENGNPYVKAEFKDGKLDGIYIAFYANGQKMGITHYKEGIKQGEATAWHENGKLASKVNFKNNARDGRMTAYYANGQKSLEAYFNEGTVDSTYSQWKENGQLYYRAWYEEGKLVDKKYFNQDSSKSKN